MGIRGATQAEVVAGIADYTIIKLTAMISVEAEIAISNVSSISVQSRGSRRNLGVAIAFWGVGGAKFVFPMPFYHWGCARSVCGAKPPSHMVAWVVLALALNPGRWIVELFNISKRPNYAQQVFGPKAMCKRDPPPLARPPHPKIDAQGAPVAKCKALLHGLANHAFEKTPKSPNTVLTTIPCGC